MTGAYFFNCSKISLIRIYKKGEVLDIMHLTICQDLTFIVVRTFVYLESTWNLKFPTKDMENRYFTWKIEILPGIKDCLDFVNILTKLFWFGKL